MAPVPDHLKKPLDRLLAGELDHLSEAEIAQLEVLLAEDDDFAAELAQTTPTHDLASLDPVPLPSAADWNTTWQQIQSATAGRYRRLHVWQPASAAAAAILLTLGLWTSRPPAAPDAWTVAWAQDVEVTELVAVQNAEPLVGADHWPVAWGGDVEVQALETGDDIIPLMIQAGDSGGPVIWALST